MNIAKKLKNVVIFEEDDKEFNEFMKGIKKSELKIVPIQVPKDIENIDASYINNKWYTKSIDDAILCGKNKVYGVIAFADNKINERIVKNIIETNKMNVKTSKFIPFETKGDVVTSWYEEGIMVCDEIERIPSSKYSVSNYIK